MEFAATANAVDEIAYWNEQKLPIRTLIVIFLKFILALFYIN